MNKTISCLIADADECDPLERDVELLGEFVAAEVDIANRQL
jgi:hypothetical protein